MFYFHVLIECASSRSDFAFSHTAVEAMTGNVGKVWWGGYNISDV